VSSARVRPLALNTLADPVTTSTRPAVRANRPSRANLMARATRTNYSPSALLVSCRHLWELIALSSPPAGLNIGRYLPSQKTG